MGPFYVHSGHADAYHYVSAAFSLLETLHNTRTTCHLLRLASRSRGSPEELIMTTVRRRDWVSQKVTHMDVASGKETPCDLLYFIYTHPDSRHILNNDTHILFFMDPFRWSHRGNSGGVSVLRKEQSAFMLHWWIEHNDCTNIVSCEIFLNKWVIWKIVGKNRKV